MNSIHTKSKDFFYSLNVIHFSLIAGQFFFALVIFYITINGSSYYVERDLTNLFLVLIPVVAIGGIYLSLVIYKNRLSEVKSKSALSEKMKNYRIASILRWAIIEFPSFMAIIAYFLTSEVFFLGIVALIIAYFFMIKPSPEKCGVDLDLDYNEKNFICDPESIIF